MAKQEKKEASRKSCVTCHGEDYDLMFDNWLEGASKVLTEYGQFIKAAKRDFAAAGGSKRARTKVREALSRMEYNYRFVQEGHIPHNIRYSLYLLNASAEQFEKAMKKINRSYRAPERGGSLRPEKSCVTFCHGKAFQPEEVAYQDSQLPHQLHVEDMELGCESCHSLTQHGKLEVKKAVCNECH
jgi:hypothetical protein